MDEIINKILDIDRQAEERLLQAEKDKIKILNEAKLQEMEIKENCILRADDRIEKVESSEKKSADEQIEKITSEMKAKMADLDKLFNDNKEKWENEIFHRIVGE